MGAEINQLQNFIRNVPIPTSLPSAHRENSTSVSTSEAVYKLQLIPVERCEKSQLLQATSESQVITSTKKCPLVINKR